MVIIYNFNPFTKEGYDPFEVNVLDQDDIYEFIEEFDLDDDYEEEPED